jgi:hypothetical protein
VRKSCEAVGRFMRGGERLQLCNKAKGAEEVTGNTE